MNKDTDIRQNEFYCKTRREAKQVWDEYSSQIQDLSSVLRPIARKYISERKGAFSQNTAPFAVQLPLLLSEPFKIKPEVRKRAALANLYIDNFIQAFDDATDNERSKPTTLHLSHTLLTKGISLYHGLADNSREFSAELEKLLEESMEAERFLWKHHDYVVPYKKKDFDMMGLRGSFLKSSLALYSSLTNDWTKYKILGGGVDASSTVVQLIDDLIDWQEDLRDGIYTHPLALAISQLPDFKSDREDVVLSDQYGRKIGEKIFFTDIADKTLAIAQGYLEVAKESFEKGDAKLSTKALSTRIKELTIRVASARNEVSKLKDPKTAEKIAKRKKLGWLARQEKAFEGGH